MFWGDYLRDTAHLRLDEHGAYIKMLAHYYSTGKPLPANEQELQRICVAFEQRERDAVARVTREFFTLQDDGYHNKRADEELAKRRKLSETRSNAAKSGKGKRDRTPEELLELPADQPTLMSMTEAAALINHLRPDDDSSANAEHLNSNTTAEGQQDGQQNSSPTTTTTAILKKPFFTTNPGVDGYPPEFEQVWLARPRRNGADPKPWAYHAWRARILEGKVTVAKAFAQVEAYRKWCVATDKIDTESVMQLQTFFGPKKEGYLVEWVSPKAAANAHVGFDDVDYADGVDNEGKF
jgi:uncharacterized protein YdaU (DUF1376 family)